MGRDLLGEGARGCGSRGTVCRMAGEEELLLILLSSGMGRRIGEDGGGFEHVDLVGLEVRVE